MASSFSNHFLLHPPPQFLFVALALILPFIITCNSHIVTQCERFIVNDQNVVTNQVKNAISDLLNSAPKVGFAQTNFASVYGLAWCRGDSSASLCSACLANAAKKLQNVRANNVAGARSLFNDFCYLRFDTKDFRGEWDKLFLRIWYDRTADRIVREHRAAFQVSVSVLLNYLKQAAPRLQLKMFATMDANFHTEMSKIYGMAQCSLDLSMESYPISV